MAWVKATGRRDLETFKFWDLVQLILEVWQQNLTGLNLNGLLSQVLSHWKVAVLVHIDVILAQILVMFYTHLNDF